MNLMFPINYLRNLLKNCLNLGHELGMNKDIKGIINCAISKVHLNDNKG